MDKHGRPRKKVTREQVKIALILAIVLLLVGLVLVVSALFSLYHENETSKTTVTTTSATTTTATTATAVTTTATTTQTTAAATTKLTVTTLSAEGRYVQPANAVWYLKLANDWNTLPEEYDSSFTAVELIPGNAKTLFDSRAVEALREMIAAGNAADPSLNLQAVSCYRSVARQKTLYWNEVDKWKKKGYGQADAEVKAATVVKRPGQSEHSTGLAVDVGGSGNYSLSQDFENTASFKWLYEHCAEYGFILRFPKGKEDVTGVIYEPWHYRYVGKEVAKEIMSNGWCLEEYLEKTGQ